MMVEKLTFAGILSSITSGDSHDLSGTLLLGPEGPQKISGDQRIVLERAISRLSVLGIEVERQAVPLLAGHRRDIHEQVTPRDVEMLGALAEAVFAPARTSYEKHRKLIKTVAQAFPNEDATDTRPSKRKTNSALRSATILVENLSAISEGQVFKMPSPRSTLLGM